MRPFLVCLHDATPAYADETRVILNDLAPLVGRRLSVGVVPNWHGQWPLAAHPEYCTLIAAYAEELLLHGYFHHRQRGHGAVSWLAASSDEMNGLDANATAHIIQGGQHVFIEAFGARARGFLAPAWQQGHLRVAGSETFGLEHVLGFFSIKSGNNTRIPLATWTWDCGEWAALGHVGNGVGALLQSVTRGIPVLAIHPRDLHRGFWPRILRLTRQLLHAGYEPMTPAGLIKSRC